MMPDMDTVIAILRGTPRVTVAVAFEHYASVADLFADYPDVDVVPSDFVRPSQAVVTKGGQTAIVQLNKLFTTEVVFNDIIM